MGTISYLSFEGEGYDSPGYGPQQLKEAALVLGWDPDLSPNVICARIKEIVPSRDWFVRNLEISSTFNEKIKDLISSYISYAYNSINRSLRLSPGSHAPLNDSIDELPPLDKEIIVMRRVDVKDLKLPTGPFESTGYLSTSIAYQNYLDPRAPRSSTYLKIYVPAGTKALFVPGREEELIFKHGVILEVLRQYQRKIGNITMNWYDLVMH